MTRRPLGTRRGSAVASGLLGDLVEVFQPSRRHVEAELERQRQDVRRPGTGAPPLHVDLEAGVAYVPASRTVAEGHREPTSPPRPTARQPHPTDGRAPATAVPAEEADVPAAGAGRSSREADWSLLPGRTGPDRTAPPTRPRRRPGQDVR